MPATTIREMLLEAMAAQGESWADFICHDAVDDLFDMAPYDAKGGAYLTFHAWTNRRVYYLALNDVESWVMESVPRHPPD